MLHQVGVGALGPVFRTYEPTRDRLVAVKVFRLDITPEQAQSLADELALAAEAGLFHPSIVEPIASGVEGTAAYRAEEYVAAESLDIAVRHYAPATVEKVLTFITQMAGAIDFARTAGVGHGALHPRDIFVTPEEARITGFGVVEALQRCGIRAPVRRPYSAPERVAGEPWSTPADVFSLAAITYELLTGRRPSGLGADVGADGLSEPVHAVLARALDEDPAARFATALAFASALEAAGRGEAPAAAPTPRKTKKSKAAAAAAATAAAAAAPEPADRDLVEQLTPRENLDERAEPEFDDVAAERDEDLAHLTLLREEQARAEAEAAAHPSSLFGEEEDEAIADLALDAHAREETARFADEFMVAASDEPVVEPIAEAAAGPRSAIDSLREEVRAREARAERAREAREDAQRLEEEQRRQEAQRHEARRQEELAFASVHEPLGTYAPAPPVAHDRGRAPMFAIAVVVVLGLLVGFAAGYAVGLREGARQASDAPSTEGAAPAAADPSAKPFIDQDVTPAQKPADPPPAVGEGPPAGSPRTPPVTSPPPSTAASPPRPAAPRTGRIVVNSTPAGAAVTIDKQWRGRTPITLDDMAFGVHEVRVVQEGYAVGRQQVTLSEGTPNRSLSFQLKRDAPAASRGAANTSKPAPERAPARAPAAQSFLGSIYVDSRPQGARVILDGKMVGVTPIRIPDVAIGSHVIRLQLEAHRDWTISTRVVAGKEERVSGSLDPIR